MKADHENSSLNSYFGLSGLQLPIPKYKYPPEHQATSRLTYYATFFNSIEINSTFYKLPMPATAGKWAAQVPDDFKFTFKLWKEITHVKGLAFKETDVEAFFKVIASAGAKKGCVLVQFPPSLGKSNIWQLDALLKYISQCNVDGSWNIAVEFRNKTWYHEDVYGLIEKYKAAIVIQDIPKSVTPFLNHASEFIYVRFHGPTGNYRESYAEDFLAEYSTYIKEWLEEGKTVYAYFNNTMGDAFQNSQQLKRFTLSLEE
ncbi:MAG: hypothetical protein K0R51_3227 [Cytophagaceae bacterium]|jgi:uncharacterized protein YecE (DUF72 family)|nr:hypothetical protein [Cytophagaceae bacterium]